MAEFVVSARKYRPKKFDEVVGQEHVSATLKNALQQDQLAHAFLFCGPRGVGKTTCARILAKVINCKNKTEDFEPCGTCDSCVSFQNNASFNISELDAASNNSVDNIRSLVDQVRIPPQAGKYKVYIIDEVHMLSQAAFNAFLKTLEEPPPYAIFILATTEKHKILPTILSRCQIYDFKRISVPAIAAHLARIAEKENIQAEPLALHVIAEKSDGALRDALSLFDRLSSGSKGNLKYDQVISQLNILDYDVYFKIIDSLLLEDISSILVQLDDVVQRGFEPDVFLLGLAEHIRNLMVAKDQQTIHLLEISDQLKDRYVEQSYLCSHSLLITSLDLLNECDIHYKSARNKRLHVEIALIKLASVRRVLQTDLATLSIEKKTEVISSAIQKEAIQKEEFPEENIASKKENAYNTVVEDTKQEYESVEPELVSDAQKDKKHKVREKLLIGPKLKDTVELVKKVEEEALEEAGRESRLNHDNIMNVWKEYAEISSSPSLKTCMESALVSYASNHIQIIVGSSVARNLIIQETGLIEKIREDLHAKDVTLEVQVDGSRNGEPEQNIKPRTPQEKYEHLVSKNPLVEKLVKDLQLKPEE